MTFFKEILKEIRKFYFKKDNSKKIIASTLIIGIIIGLLMDIFLPFSNIFNYIRLLPAAAIAFSSFTLIYINFVVKRTTKKRSLDFNYIPIKDRYPPKIRNIYGAVSLSIVLVLVIAGSRSESFLYTFIAGISIAAIALIAQFVALTEKEIAIREHGAIDSRDIALNNRLEELKKQSERKSKIRQKASIDE